MAVEARVRFGIIFEGSSQCWEKANICAIDLHGLKSRVSAVSGKTGDSTMQAGKLQWNIVNKDAHPLCFEAQKLADEIGLTSAVANSFTLTARVFESYDNLSKSERKLEGSVKPQQWVKRYDVDIEMGEHPAFEPGQGYLIRIQNIGECNLRASFVKQQSKISPAKSVTQSRVAPTVPTETSCEPVTIDPSTLSPEALRQIMSGYAIGQTARRVAFGVSGSSGVTLEEKLMTYEDLASLTVSLRTYIESFVKEAGLSMPKNLVFCHVALNELKNQIKSMKDRDFATFKEAREKGNIEECIRKEKEALGFEGYSAIMRVALKEVVSKEVSNYEVTMQKYVKQYAEHMSLSFV